MKMGEDLGLETGETKNADDDVRSSSDVIGFGEAWGLLGPGACWGMAGAILNASSYYYGVLDLVLL